MNMYTLLLAANKTDNEDDIFEKCEAMGDLLYINDFSDWKIVGHDEPMAILQPETLTLTVDPTLPPNSIKAETVIADNLIIAGREFDDIINSIVCDALEESRKLNK